MPHLVLVRRICTHAMRLTFFGAFFLAAVSFAQSTWMRPPLELHSGRTRIVIPQHDEHGAHDFCSETCRGSIEQSVLHAAIRRGDTLYVVFTCTGSSRGPNATGGRCGSGWEHQINWMAIRGDAVVQHRREDIESCWQDISGQLGGWRHGLLVWSAEHGISFDPAEVTGYFDPQAPQKGLQMKKSETTNPNA